jgi:hypothetical protein
MAAPSINLIDRAERAAEAGRGACGRPNWLAHVPPPPFFLLLFFFFSLYK